MRSTSWAQKRLRNLRTLPQREAAAELATAGSGKCSPGRMPPVAMNHVPDVDSTPLNALAARQLVFLTGSLPRKLRANAVYSREFHMLGRQTSPIRWAM